ncbi:hypothetical protein MPER_06902 [Moniliophthora perniciosa FA553]|nr:hypothetical protein MPER_06902 [Moniliophthora perniciosa FA553]
MDQQPSDSAADATEVANQLNIDVADVPMSNTDYSPKPPDDGVKRAPLYFFDDGNIALQACNSPYIYNVHRSILKKLEVFRDMLDQGNPEVKVVDGLPEGSIYNPVVLESIPEEEVEAMLWLLYGMESFLNDEHLRAEKLLCILKVAHRYCYQAGIDFAVRKLRFSATFNTGQKLSLGILHQQREWVVGALNEIYRTGEMKIEQDDVGGWQISAFI